jgi:hypothetical protein
MARVPLFLDCMERSGSLVHLKVFGGFGVLLRLLLFLSELLLQGNLS